MCACGGVVETALLCYIAKKVYDMSAKRKSTSCKVCHCVAIPDKDICPECLMDDTADLDTLDPWEFEEITGDLIDDNDSCILGEHPVYVG